ncbi:MAG: NAD(P)H-binding protein [Synechococcales bacterium]|nr:NAD(P)H-binding protein [Synechococcales bacterium]
MKAFVAGATGETGRRIVAELVQRNIPVRALVRDLDKGRDLLPDPVELVVGDVLKPETLVDAIADSTVLLCATGATPSFDVTGPYKVDYEGTRHLADAAKAKGLEQFVFVSSLCVSKFFHPLNLFWLVLYWKKQAEEYLQSSGIPYTIVRPGGLKNENDENSIVMAGADTLFEGSIPRVKVAQVCVEALFHPDARNQVVEIVTQAEAPAKPFAQLFAEVGGTRVAS